MGGGVAGWLFVVDEILRNQCFEKLEWNLGVRIEKLITDCGRHMWVIMGNILDDRSAF